MSKAELVTKKMLENNLTITFMESCTSGLLASMFTDTEGASAVFKGSFVTYSNEEKIAQGVEASVIGKFGVYSKECAREMAKVSQKHFDSDFSVGITGTTGNTDPANPDSIQGTAYFCILCKKKSGGFEYFDFKIEKDVSGFSRAQIKNMYAECVYERLLEILTFSSQCQTTFASS